MFDITALYELKAADNQKTTFSYTVTNHALKWFIKPFLWFASDKVVVEFLERVKKVAETEKIKNERVNALFILILIVN